MKAFRVQQGFTLIELVVVIVILGILAAVALPKFVDLSQEASTAAAEGVAANLASATAMNYGARKAGDTAAVVLNQANVCQNTVLQPFVRGVTLIGGTATPANNKEFKVTGTGDCSVATNDVVSCSIQGKDGSAVTAQIICAR